MSDGALSQAEIDALLSGVDSGSLGGPAPAPTLGGNEEERKTLQNLLTETDENQGRAVSTMTGSTINFSGPEVSFSNQDSLREQLPAQVVVVKADFTTGFPGEHTFIMSEDMAKQLTSLINAKENMQEGTEGISKEIVSQLVGTQITAFTKATGNSSIASIPPEANIMAKGVVPLSNGTFPIAVYTIDMAPGSQEKLWEVYGANVVTAIVNAMNPPKAAAPQPVAQAHPAAASIPNMGGLQMPPMQGGYPMGYPPQGYPMPAMTPAYALPPNVQSVQFPNLMPHNAAMEQGNIGLIMDVFMEMTVELGRTKKLIKEILSMGEGTIIELDKLAGEPVDILVNRKLIAKGEVVVIDENFGVRVTEIVSPSERVGPGV